MFPIQLEPKEIWDEENEQFLYFGPEKTLNLNLEHSLVSISKWESKYHKPYLSSEKTADEALDYLQMMVIGEYEDKIDKDWFKVLTRQQVEEIDSYVNNPMTATTFSSDKEAKEKEKNGNKNKKLNGEIITNELMYYWMTALNIPFECQYWHLNRLITLVRVCSIKNQPKDKKKKKGLTSTQMAERRARMEAARAKYKH